MGKNRHSTLNFSVAKSVCSRYFKLWILFKNLSDFTVTIFGVPRVLTVVSIIEKVMIDFF